MYQVKVELRSAKTKKSCRQVSRIHLQQQGRDQDEVTLEKAKSPSKWLAVALLPLHWRDWEFSTALYLATVGTAVEASMGIMTRQGKHSLPRRWKDRLWTVRPSFKGRWSQVLLNKAKSFTLGKFGFGEKLLPRTVTKKQSVITVSSLSEI